MAESNWPTQFDELKTWAENHGVSVVEARKRLAQYGVLLAITKSSHLSKSFVFKGGNALDFFWSPNRSTSDLDFSIVDGEETEDSLRVELKKALSALPPELGISYLVQRLRRNPPNPEASFPSYEVNVGYAFVDDRSDTEKIRRGEPVNAVVPMDLSINEVVCEAIEQSLQVGNETLMVCSPADIAAEKLRALLQQPIRNRQRSQDVLDLAVLIGSATSLDLVKVADFLTQKCASRSVPCSKTAFHNAEIRERAKREYDDLKSTAREQFIEFEAAFATVLSFVGKLDIPEDHNAK